MASTELCGLQEVDEELLAKLYAQRADLGDPTEEDIRQSLIRTNNHGGRTRRQLLDDADDRRYFAERRAQMEAAPAHQPEPAEAEPEPLDPEEQKEEEARQAVFALKIDLRSAAQKKAGKEAWQAMCWTDRLALCRASEGDANQPGEIDPFKIMRENSAAAEVKQAEDEVTQDLLSAAKKGNIEGVRAALAGGAEIDASDRLGFTALALACLKGYGELAELLISEGANLRVVLRQGTLLGIAIQFKQVAVAELLLARGAPVDMKSLQKLMDMQGTEDEAKFNNVMTEAVLRLESQTDEQTSRDFLLGQTMQSLMAAKLAPSDD